MANSTNHTWSANKDANGVSAGFCTDEIKTITGTSPASAITDTIGDVITNCSQYRYLTVYANTIRGGTGGTLDIYVQTSFDGGSTWEDYAAFDQLSDGVAASKKEFKVVKDVQITTIFTPSDGTMAAGTVRGGAWGDRFRLKGKAGVGTSAGATQTVKFYFSS